MNTRSENQALFSECVETLHSQGLAALPPELPHPVVANLIAWFVDCFADSEDRGQLLFLDAAEAFVANAQTREDKANE